MTTLKFNSEEYVYKTIFESTRHTWEQKLESASKYAMNIVNQSIERNLTLLIFNQTGCIPFNHLIQT
jgi:hypothetical protein